MWVTIKFYDKVKRWNVHSVMVFITPIIHCIKHFSVTIVRLILECTICIRLMRHEAKFDVNRKPPMNSYSNSQPHFF